MKLPLIVSLIANAVLLTGVAYLVPGKSANRPAGDFRVATISDLPKSAPLIQAVAASPSPVTVPAPAPWQSPADIQAWLLSSGAPLEVRYAVAQAMVSRKYQPAYEAVRFPSGMKKWQRGATRPTPEQIEQQAILREQQEEEMKRLLGPDYLQARYGGGERLSGMPVGKIAEINRITREYTDARRKLGEGVQQPGVSRLMEEEMNTDLRKVLTPAEYEDYRAYESSEGQQLQRALAGLDIDDEEYLRAFRSVAEIRAKNPESRYSPSVRLEEVRAIEQVLGVEAASHIAMNQDSTFRQIGALYSTSGLPAAARLGKYQAMLQFYKDTQGWGPQTVPSDSQLALVRSYRDRLTEGLSDTDRTKFDRTPTGSLISRLLHGK